MAAEILRPRFRLAHNHSGANLVSGVASTLLAAGDAELGLLEVDEGALPEVLRRVKPRAVCLGNLFRDQLDRYGELELVAERWRDRCRRPPGRDDPRAERRRPADRLARRRRSSSASTTRAWRAPAPARGRLQVLHPLRHALRLRGRLRRASRRLPLPELRACAAAARRRRPGHRAARARARRASISSRPRARGASSSRLPGLYNVYNALGAAALAQALGASLDEIAAGLGALQRRLRPVRAYPRRRQAAPAAPDQEPRRRERGRAHARRRRPAPRRRRRVERRDRRRPRRVVDLGRRLRAAARRARDGSSPPASARPSSRSASSTAASTRPASSSSRRSKRALDRGLALTPAGGELVVLPTYTAMLALQRIVAERGLAKPYWERAA